MLNSFELCLVNRYWWLGVCSISIQVIIPWISWSWRFTLSTIRQHTTSPHLSETPCSNHTVLWRFVHFLIFTLATPQTAHIFDLTVAALQLWWTHILNFQHNIEFRTTPFLQTDKTCICSIVFHWSCLCWTSPHSCWPFASKVKTTLLTWQCVQHIILWIQ